jgi:hypothetical protein
MGTAKMIGVPKTPPKTSDKKVVGSTVETAVVRVGEGKAAVLVMAMFDDDVEGRTTNASTSC